MNYFENARLVFVKSVIAVLLFYCVYNGLNYVVAKEKPGFHYTTLEGPYDIRTVDELAERYAEEAGMSKSTYIKEVYRINHLASEQLMCAEIIRVPYVSDTSSTEP